MRIYKRGKYWWAEGYDARGERWRVSTKVAVEGDQKGTRAKKRAKQIERERLLEGPSAPPLYLADALEALRDAKELKGRSEATMQILAEKGGVLLAVLGADFDLQRMTLDDSEAYVRTRRADGVTDHTIEKEFRELRAALHVASKRGKFVGKPSDLWPDVFENVYTPRSRWLTRSEFNLLHAEAFEGRREHLLAYVHLGVRQSELFRIRAEHVGDGRVYIDGTKTKAAKRWVPITPDIRPVLERRSREGGQLFEPWLRQNMRQALHAWCARAGIAPVSANDLRRTYATWMAEAGTPEAALLKFMGHKSSAMIRAVYAQITPKVMAEAAAAFPRVEPDKGEACTPIRVPTMCENGGQTMGLVGLHA